MLEFACDVLIDIPKFWEFLGEIVAPSLASGALRLAPFFEETTAALAKGTENSPDFSGETMEISIRGSFTNDVSRKGAGEGGGLPKY